MFCHQCGRALEGSHNFCPTCGEAVVRDQPSPEISSASDQHQVLDHETSTNASKKFDEIGTILFGICSALTLLAGIVRGFPPIDIIEAICWGVMSWYWYKRHPHVRFSMGTVMVFAILLATAELASISQSVRHREPEKPKFDLDALLEHGQQSTEKTPRFNLDDRPVGPIAAAPLTNLASKTTLKMANKPQAARSRLGCPVELAPGEMRIAYRISDDQISLVKAKLSLDSASQMGEPYFHFNMNNGTNGLCITAVDIDVFYNYSDGLEKKCVTTLRFNAPLAPRQGGREMDQ